MLKIGAVDEAKIYKAFMEAFADYAMDAGATTEQGLLLRMRKNAVDYAASVGIYDRDRLVGFTLIGIDRWGDRVVAYDAGTGIVPEFRGRRLAAQMFEHALPGLRRRGVSRFVLEVLQQNEPAIKAYRRSGFEVTRELRSFVAKVSLLRELNPGDHLEIRSIDRSVFARLEPSANRLPSFENRFSALDAIPKHVRLVGAFDGEICVGALAYASPLNWLLTLLVAPQYRRRGVGRALIRHLALTLPESVKHLAALNVDGGDAGTQAFFASLGFTHLVDQFEMVRAL